MLVPLVVVAALLGAALAALLARSARQRGRAALAEARLARLEHRAASTVGVLQGAHVPPAASAEPPDTPDRPARRRTRRPGPTVSPDRP